jgi:hypothetical protein
MAVDAGDDGAQQWQVDVVVGIISSRSAGPNAWAQCGQAASVASMILSGCSVNARATPGRPPRGFFGRSGKFDFRPFEGGMLELSGVFAGAASLASNSAIRAVRTLIC